MIKRVYSQPTSKLLVVRFGGAILQASQDIPNQGGSFGDSGADVDDSHINDDDWGW